MFKVIEKGMELAKKIDEQETILKEKA